MCIDSQQRDLHSFIQICPLFLELSKNILMGWFVEHRIVISEFVGVVVSTSDEKKAPPYVHVTTSKGALYIQYKNHMCQAQKKSINFCFQKRLTFALAAAVTLSLNLRGQS